MPSSRELANALRALSMDAVQKANSGHPGMPMGMADVATLLFSDYLKFSPAQPQWADRDRFILSAGHGSMLLYALLHLTGYEDFSLEELKNFRQLGARTAGHPEYGHGAGIETTTGPLGQGLANAVGMALAERLLAAEFGEALVNHRTWVVAGDGCLMEGISHEAASLAGHLQLAKLNVLFDDNQICIDGSTALTTSDNTRLRFESYGWHVCECDGHNEASIRAALDAAVAASKPSLVMCKTIIGYGAPNKQGTASTHGAPLGDDEVAAARAALNWTHPPFEIPDDIKTAWRGIGERGAAAFNQWQAQAQADSHYDELARRMRGELPQNWEANFQKWCSEQTNDKMATRKASQVALQKLSEELPELLGGSADLSGSNLTHVGQGVVAPALQGSERYIHYGVREHGMAAMMNGIALHGGFIPYGGTFLVFTDYCRPAIRLSALMQQRVVYVMTHDSIGLGEDGPTHQPIEHLASLRAIPNLRVWRPCDAAETAQCWRAAIKHDSGPSLLALSRQGLPAVSATPEACERGAYVLANNGGEDSGERQLTLIGSGSEVSLLLEIQKSLTDVNCAVVSVPCMELFVEQGEDYKASVIPPHIPVLAAEAASPQAWQALAQQLKLQAFDCLCLNTFGTSAPASDAYQHFNITTEAGVKKAQALLGITPKN